MHPDEVRATLQRVVQKLDAQSRLEAMIVAVRQGLLELPSA